MVIKKQKAAFKAAFFCRGEKTRTSGLYVPNVARYQLRHTPKFNAKVKKIITSAKYKSLIRQLFLFKKTSINNYCDYRVSGNINGSL